jgi:predicted enzyme related to lactoylglutathione lyase
MPNPFAHVELHSGDVNDSKKFYKSLFAWTLKDMPEMDYTMIDVGTGTGGGIMKKPMPEAPSQWLPYVQVDSVKKTVDKAKKLGAGVLLEYQAIGDMGAIGVITDPGGAAIGLWEMGKGAKAAAPKKAAKKAAKKAPPKAAKKAPKKAAKKAAKKK